MSVTLATTIQLYPGQEAEVVIDCSDQLTSPTVLSGSPISSAIMLVGLDNPSNCLNGTPTLSVANTRLVVPVKGSLDWATYLITVSCPTTDPKIITTHSFEIQCRAIPNLLS